MSHRNHSSEENPSSREPSRRSRSRRKERDSKTSTKRRRWPFVVLALGLFVFFLPTLIGATSLKQKAINWALADYSGDVTVGAASLGWFSPIVLNDLQMTDLNGDPMVQVGRVKTSKPLASFLYSSDYGMVDVEAPKLFLTSRPDGSNLEDAIAALIPTESLEDDESTLPSVKMNVVGGEVQIISSATGEQWNVANLSVQGELKDAAVPVTAQLECQFFNEGEAYGGLAVAANVNSASNMSSFDSVSAVVNTQNLPLGLLSPLAHRVLGPSTADGYLTGEFQTNVNLVSGDAEVDLSQFQLDRATVAIPAYLGTDAIHTQRSIAVGKVAMVQGRIEADQFRFEGDLANVNINGRFDLGQLSELLSGGPLLNEPFQMDGRVDIARVASMMPQTLMLHEDLKIESGVVQFNVSTIVETNAPKVVVNVDTANIRAIRGGQPLVWQKPLRVVGTLYESDGQWTFNNVRCETDFLTILGDGTLQKGQVRIDGDLQPLITRMNQFADLGGLKMAGKIEGGFEWKLGDEGGQNVLQSPIQLDGDLIVNGPLIEWPGLQPWRPAQLNMVIAGVGQAVDDGLKVSTGRAEINIGTEQLLLALVKPIENVLQASSLQFDCRALGRAGGWVQHVNNFVSLGDVRAEGQVDLNSLVTLDGSRLRFNKLRYEIRQFGFDGFATSIREELLAGNGNLNYDLDTGKMDVLNFSANGKSVVANTKDFEIVASDPLRLQGTIFYRADLNRVADWWSLQSTADSVRWFGLAEGNVQLLANERGAIGGEVATRIKDLVAAQFTSAVVSRGNQDVGPPAQLASARRELSELWREATVQLNSKFQMSEDYNSITVQNAKIVGAAVQANVDGAIDDLAGNFNTRLSGNWLPDWNVVNGLLSAYTGDMLEFGGNGWQPFELSGPLFDTTASGSKGWVSPQLSARTRLAWNEARFMKLPIGATTIDVDLNQAVAVLNVNELPIAGNQLSFAPQIDLRTENPLLFMPDGTLVDDLQLTPETCREYLKFVAPMIADATAAEGTFTVTTAGVQVPLMDPMAVAARGDLQLKGVTIGAGPLADQLLAAVSQIRNLLKPGATRDPRDNSQWIRMSEQTVPFAIQNQRVHHQGITFQYKDVLLRTRGSVGLDQTVDMIAEIPILDDWIKSEPWLAGLKGQSLSIPISGTVTKPQLDRGAMQRISTQLAKQAAGSAINKAIGDKLGVAPGQIQNTLSNKLGEEVGRVQEKIGNKFQEEVGQRLENELKNGFNNLFKRKDKRP